MAPPEEAHKPHSKKARQSLAEFTAMRDGAAGVQALQAIIDAVPDPVVVFDPELRVIQSNAAHRAVRSRFFSKVPPIEFHERAQVTQTVFFDAAGAPAPQEQWPQQRILRGETLSGPTAVEARATTLQGEAQWWSVSGAPLRAGDGAITGVVVVFTDITARKCAEAELRRANERFQLAERAVDGFVYEWNPHDGIHFRSAGFERMLGYRPEEIAPTWAAWAQLVYPGDWQVTTDVEELAYLEALPGETLENEYRMRHRDGHYLTVAEHTLIERNASGNVTRLIGQIHDITERKQAEETLRRSEAGLRALADLVPDLLWSADPPGQKISYNQRWCDYTGQSHEETQAYGWLRVIHPADRMATYAAFAHAFASGQSLERELRVRRHDGVYRWFLIRHAPVRDERGRIAQWFGSATDIHDRRMARIVLERQVAERTRQLAAANLALRRLSQRILQVQESERRLIAQELHDEIGQQLTGAKMLLDSLYEQFHAKRQALPANQAQRDERQSTLARLRELRDIVGQTLEDVRRLSLELRPAILDSLGLLATLQWQFERYTKQTGVQVDFAADGLDHRLPAQLEAGVYRLVQEALTNVARHAGVAAVTVQIYVTEKTLSLFIVDEGAGFDVENTLVAGASTGLAGMRERADLLGGSLTVDSLPGEGTTIHAELSITQAREMEATQESDHGARETPEDGLRESTRDQRRDAARDAQRDTLRDAMRDAARDAARDVKRDALHDQQREDGNP